MSARLAALVAALALLAVAPAAAQQPEVPLPQYPGSFELVGHDPLMNRGMNAALAVFGGYAYVGSRTDGTHANAGVMVVDVRDPKAPQVVDEIGPPDEGLPTQTSRELRVLPDQKLLLVLNHQCSELIHRCATPSSTGLSVFPSNIKVFDIAGENAAAPKLVGTYLPSATGPQLPHEFFVWNDPKRPGRVLLFSSAPREDQDLVVTDFSRAREGVFTEIAKFTSEANDGLHSMTVSHDGRRMYLAHLQGGMLVADTSEVAENRENPKITQLTGPDDAPTWEGPGAHSTVQIPGRPDHVMVTDEVYGKFGGVLAGHGCPWGWVRFVNARDPRKPAVESEYKLPVNEPAFCEGLEADRDNFGSLSAHNPTLTEHLALLSWHGAGMQALVTADPARPAPAAGFMPEPLPVVQTEDPVLSMGRDKVVMWSFPSVVDGLVYVVDLRNGLYVLRYKGPYQEEVERVRFLDGASNSGDIARIEDAAAGGGGGGAGGPGGPGGGAGPSGPKPPGSKPCLASPLRLRGKSLGPFSVGMTRAKVRLRGGPSTSQGRRRLTWCVQGGGSVAVVLNKRGRVAFVGTSARGFRGPRGLRPGGRARLSRGARRVRGGFVVVRGRKSSVVARVRGGRVRWTGVVAGRPSAKALRALARASGL